MEQDRCPSRIAGEAEGGILALTQLSSENHTPDVIGGVR